MSMSFSSLGVVKFCFSKFFEVIKNDKSLLNSFFISIIIFSLAIIFNISLPLVIKFIILSLEEVSSNYQLILLAVCVYGIMWTIAQVGEHIREITSVRAIERILRKLTISFYQTVISQPSPHNESFSTDSIINKLTIFRDGFQNLIWGFLFFLLPTLIEILCACFVLWYFCGFFYSLALLLTIVTYSICTAFGIVRYLKHQTQTFEIASQVTGFLSDRLFNIETVNHFGTPEREIELLNKKLTHLENKTIKTKQLFEKIRIAQGIIIGCALTLVTYKSINDILVGSQSLSDFILINSYIIQFFAPLSSLGIVMNDLYKSFAEVAGFLKLIKPCEDKNLKTESLIKNTISSPAALFTKDLWFSYESNDLSFSLKNINISLEAGWKVGIVGASGSGKSTLGKLLGSLYTSKKGEIFFNGLTYSSYNRLSLKKTIALAPQHVQLFYDTMIANIMYANPDATLEELEEAVRAAQLQEVINRLSNGLNTFLGEQGACLSGGEKQRIGIARAILKKPSLYILDEPTSFLDTKTEKLIMDYFKFMKKKVTQIIITHRLSTVMDADWILVMEKGQVIYQGTPQYLIKNSKSFNELCNLDIY
ncbi:MAG: ABC transporter ATP-binding protein [Alphaproteobacteria bacterium]